MIAKSALLVAAALASGSSDALPLRLTHLNSLAVRLNVDAPLPSPLPLTSRLLGNGILAERITPAASARAARVSTALTVLGAGVERQSHPDALRLAFAAYYNFKAQHGDRLRNPYLYFVDFGLDSRSPRGYVFNMETLQLVDGPFTVAHGSGSAGDGDGVPTRFSNTQGSNATSLGLFLTQETYAFRGKSNGTPYRSVGLRLLGLSDRFNSRARARGVVIHGAPYVTALRAGRSEGCPAMEPGRAERLIPQIANGGMMFLFSPLDPQWMNYEVRALGDPRVAGLLGG